MTMIIQLSDAVGEVLTDYASAHGKTVPELIARWFNAQLVRDAEQARIQKHVDWFERFDHAVTKEKE